jgi:outer membrane lipoprotein-sorting protein
MRFLLSISLLALALPLGAAAPPDVTPVKKWLARQDEFRNVQADFTQTRSLRALRSPIAVPGHLCFSTPNSLRWELGDPPKTVVLRKGETYLLIQPAKKKAQRLSAGSVAQEGGSRGFAMMEFPLAKDFPEFNRKFEILAVDTEGHHCHLEILPRDAQARKFLSALKIDFDTATGHMLSFEMATKDGSSMRNEFSNVRVNQKIDRRIFEYDLTGYEVVDEKN